MVNAFPDETSMPRSQDGSEPVRGGSIGLNRILGHFVDASGKDRKPEFAAILISAFATFRNVLGTVTSGTMDQWEEGFLKDITLFLEYYNTYCAYVWNKPFGDDKKIPIIVYFPDYYRVPKEIEREFKEGSDRDKLFKSYIKFLSRHKDQEGSARQLDHVHCFWIQAKQTTYPHVDVARKFKQIVQDPTLAYVSGAPIGLMANTTIDYHISTHLRGIRLIESFTGKVKLPQDFRFRLDKEGRLPFNAATHLAFGDSDMVKPLVVGKARRELLDDAVKDRWMSRTESDIAQRISQKAQIPLSTFRKYNFT